MLCIVSETGSLGGQEAGKVVLVSDRSLDKVGIMEKGVRTRSLCALCKDSVYNSDFFFPEHIGWQLKASHVIGAWRSVQGGGKGTSGDRRVGTTFLVFWGRKGTLRKFWPTSNRTTGQKSVWELTATVSHTQRWTLSSLLWRITVSQTVLQQRTRREDE